MFLHFHKDGLFFTKSAKEPELYLYTCNEKISPVNLRNFSLDYFFGLSRHNRVLNIQIHNIFHEIKTDSIEPLILNTNNIDSLLNKLSIEKLNFKDIFIEKKFAQDLNGNYIIVLHLQLPWPLLHQKPNYPQRYIAFPVNIIKK